MFATRRFPIAAVPALAAALALTGCLTPHSRPQVSQAVLDARAKRNLHAPTPCQSLPLSGVSPVSVGFAFEEGKLGPITRPNLDPAVEWLACHPAALAVIKPDSDNHGTEAEQNALARDRGQAVAAYLQQHGIAAGRVRLLTRTEAEPPGEHLLILAEGRRW